MKTSDEIINRTHPNGFYKAISRIIFDEDIQDYRQICYGTTNGKDFAVEVYQGPNYLTKSFSRRSWSRKYEMENLPSKFNQVVSILRDKHAKTFKI